MVVHRLDVFRLQPVAQGIDVVLNAQGFVEVVFVAVTAHHIVHLCEGTVDKICQSL